MLRFHASAVECFSEFEEALTVHFDNEEDHYLALTAWTEGFEQNAVGMGMVHVEIDDQGISGYDCFAAAELRRHSFRIIFDNSAERLAWFGEVEVTFDLDAQRYEEVRSSLHRVFRHFRGYEVVGQQSQ
jgi:hypothetical protein